MGCAPADANRGSWTKQFNARRESRNPGTRHKARVIAENRQKKGLPLFLNWSYFASPVVSDGCYRATRGRLRMLCAFQLALSLIPKSITEVQ